MKVRALILLLLLPVLANAQVAVYDFGTNIYIDTGASLTINGSFTTFNNGTVENYGTLQLKGSWYNNNFFGPLINNSGKVEFTGSEPQAIGGIFPTYFHDLSINKSGGFIILNNSDNLITNSLILQNGYLILGAYHLILDTAAVVSGNPGELSYIKAYGSGMLRKDLSDTGSFTFPVGGADHYTPLTVTVNNANFSGEDFFAVNVTDAAHGGTSQNSYLNRYWTVNAGGFNSLDYDVEMLYHDQDVSGVESDIYCQLYDGTWHVYNIADTILNILSSGTGITTIPNNADLTGGGLNLLPLKLLYFSATPEEKAVKLGWTTMEERNTHFFLVQRSHTGSDFHTLQQIPAAGNSNQVLQYHYYDERPLSGRSYYRLKQQDDNGSYTYSHIVAVERPAGKDHTINHDPGTNSLTVSATVDGQYHVALYDLNGKLLFNRDIYIHDTHSGTALFLPEGLPANMYLVSLTAEGRGIVATKKIIIY